MAHDIAEFEDHLPTAELDPLRPSGQPRPCRPAAVLRAVAPGLAVVAVAVVAAFAVNHVVASLSPLVAAVAIGAAAANIGVLPAWSRDGTHFAAKRFLRTGVVLLGFQLALSQVLALGVPALGVVTGTVAVTFLGTQWLGRKMGLDRGLCLLIATGFSICGASAVAAVEGVADASDEDVAFTIALVTLCGSLAIGLLPLLRGPLGLAGANSYGSWVGASVHDVGQVVATAASGGPIAIRAAVIIKLTRVVLLAPMVAGVGLARRRRILASGQTPTGDQTATRRPPLLPLFVAGFLAAIVLRSTAAVPTGWLNPIKDLQNIALTAALFGLGTGVRIAKLRKVGGRPLILAIASWAIIATIAYAGIKLIGA